MRMFPQSGCVSLHSSWNGNIRKIVYGGSVHRLVASCILFSLFTIIQVSSSSYFTSEEHALLIDGLVVTSSIKDPVIALAMLFATFFIFNREIQLTLKFFQRCLAGINLVSGTKYAKQGT